MYSTVREPVPDRHRAEFYFSGSGPRRDKMKKKTEKLNTKLLITVLYSIKIRGGAGGSGQSKLFIRYFLQHFNPHPRDPIWSLTSRGLIAFFGS